MTAPFSFATLCGGPLDGLSMPLAVQATQLIVRYQGSWLLYHASVIDGAEPAAVVIGVNRNCPLIEVPEGETALAYHFQRPLVPSEVQQVRNQIKASKG